MYWAYMERQVYLVHHVNSKARAQNTVGHTTHATPPLPRVGRIYWPTIPRPSRAATATYPCIAHSIVLLINYASTRMAGAENGFPSGYEPGRVGEDAVPAREICAARKGILERCRRWEGRRREGHVRGEKGKHANKLDYHVARAFKQQLAQGNKRTQ